MSFNIFLVLLLFKRHYQFGTQNFLFNRLTLNNDHEIICFFLKIMSIYTVKFINSNNYTT